MVAVMASAAHANDLVYRYRVQAELPVLRNYDNQPYWRALAECAGIYGVLSNRYEAAGMDRPALTAKDRGVSFLRAADERLQTDRGVGREEARSLTVPAVDAGRQSAGALLRTPPERGYSHEQIIDAMCSQLTDRHAEAARAAR